MSYLQAYSESDEGQAAVEEMLERKAGKIEFFQNMAPEGASGLGGGPAFRPIPKFELTAEQYEAIYPGEPMSVELGIDLGRWLIWGPESLFASWSDATSNSPIDQAVRRFSLFRAGRADSPSADKE